MVGSTRDRGATPREGTSEGREGKVAGRGIRCPVSDPATPPSLDPRLLVVRLFYFNSTIRGEGCQVPGANGGTTERPGTVREGLVIAPEGDRW